MRKRTAALIIFTLSCWLFAGCSLNPSSETAQLVQTKSDKTYVAAENCQILQNVNKDILGDAVKEKIVLYVEEAEDGLPLAWSLVVDNIEKVRLSTEDGLYFFAEIKFADVDGDQQDEVLLYRQSSGSSGARALNIYKTSPQDWQELFASHQPEPADDERFLVKYLRDYYVHFEDKTTGLKSTISLDKDQYIGNENMLPGIATWIDPIIDYSLVDHNGDGVQEIVTIQRVIGVAHVDTIGLLKTTYRMESGHYRAVILTLCDRNDKPLAEAKL